mmetsp:Transcript_1535/g.4960  ORF Transcript_1535/g.4960 Transcript_1535/m.4960 type:complete len:346 (-) Transcript_1535:273-1310(-)
MGAAMAVGEGTFRLASTLDLPVVLGGSGGGAGAGTSGAEGASGVGGASGGGDASAWRIFAHTASGSGSASHSLSPRAASSSRVSNSSSLSTSSQRSSLPFSLAGNSASKKRRSSCCCASRAEERDAESGLSEGLEHVEGASARGASPPHSGRHSGGRVSDCSDPSDCGLERRPDSALATPPPPSPPPPPSTPSPPMPSIRTLSVGTASGGANTGSTRPPPCVPPGAGGLPQSPPPCRCSCGRGGLGGMPTPPLISAGRAPRVKAGLIWTNRPKLKILPCWSAAEAEAGRTKRQKACRGGLSGGMRPRRCCVTHGRRNLMPPGATSPNTRSAAATCGSETCDGTRT